MSTMGIAVYCNGRADVGEREQLMLLRSLRDNERNVVGPARGNSKVVEHHPHHQLQQLQHHQLQPQPQQQQQQQHQQQQQRRGAHQTTTTTTAAAATAASTIALPPYDPSRLKKHGKNGQPPPIAVAKRNARERNRVKQVNNGFATLRQHIPGHVAQGYGDRGKKLSKVETLRMAVEYIRGLQRLLAEADGLEYETSRNSICGNNGDSSVMIPSPTGSVYSGSTHNGSGVDALCLAGSELDEPQIGAESVALEVEDADADPYLMDEEDEDNDKEMRESKRFRDEGTSQNRLSENQNRDRTLLNSAPRRRRNSPTTFYVTRQSASFGDEENIEPLSNSNNNNNNNNNNNINNNNNLLSGFSPILLQSTSPNNGSLPPIKREICLLDDDESQRSNEDDTATASLLTSATPYTGEILIENPETGRLMPLKLEGNDEVSPGAQLVYVATSADGLPGATYYRHELASDTVVGGGGEFMDVVSWWEQEQGRLSHQLQAHHHHHHHHHHVGQHQQTHQQTHQQLTAQQRLAHV